jgi:hypothetical protein
VVARRLRALHWLVEHRLVTNANVIVVVLLIAVILGAVVRQRSPESYLGALIVLDAVILALNRWAGTRYAGSGAVAK